jgi:8-oxo-dGTP pyrophosphatase MutT (NUDIX family)
MATSQLRRFNRYQDVEIDAGMLPHDELGKFLARLSEEETNWLGRLGRRSVSPSTRATALFWVKIPVKLSHLLPSLLGTGVFDVHHATADHVMLVKGPGTRKPTSVPLYGTHYARVECVVVDPGTGCSLIVRERIGSASCGLKLVTGSVDSAEFISQAAEREVMEETRISARFVGVLGLVNRIGTRFGRDELLVGCLLYAEPPGQAPVASSDEIVAAEWVPSGRTLDADFNFVGRRWARAAAALALSGVAQPENVLPDFRGAPHTMRMYSAM